MADSWTLVGLSWLSTYLLHSTALLCAVWAATRLVRRMPDGLQEVLWKTALCGGLVTTTWQVATEATPYGGQVQLSTPAPAVKAAPAPMPFEAPALEPLAAPILDQPIFAATSLPREEAVSSPPVAPRTDDIDWATLGLWLYGGLVGLGFGHLTVARLRFRRQLADRRLVTTGEMPLQLLELVDRAGFKRAVRLTSSPAIPTPIAFGFGQPEICVPTRALTELRPDEQESMLAHELAHLIHRDPAWLLTCQLLQRLLFLQPLHHLARFNMQRLAEYRCDAWATQHTACEISLARCLVEVARWISPGRPALAHAPGMAARRSLLWQRVDRILETDSSARPSWTAVAGSLVLLAAAATALPGASWIGVGQPSEPGNAPLPEVQVLDAAPALEALNEELRWLDGELAQLRAELADDTDPRVGELIARLEQAAGELRARRDHMESMLPSTLDALRPGASRADQDIHNAQGEN